MTISLCPNTKDDTGLTPLHWAVVRGNRMCIRRLVEAGSDVHAKDNEGRTARDMAQELKSLGAWKRALEEGGFTEDGVPKRKPLSDRNTKIIIFTMPTLFLFLMFTTLTILPWYTGIILAMALFFGMHHRYTEPLLRWYHHRLDDLGRVRLGHSPNESDGVACIHSPNSRHYHRPLCLQLLPRNQLGPWHLPQAG
ncbi:hypothetical protein BD311DRAFT_164470 [Dichomitus squalens]|uniref:Uncharacterized protein n=1 Tax=Dichomitus squalens TaxID=114155 RepID=A0A4V2K114_9APHY|nr:hypothetical protein BD311DRAFT_164470 [Dichomitus squalens]